MTDSYQIITVGPNQEASVSRTLDRLGLQHDWFRVQRSVVYRGRLILRTFPLFPGYIFLAASYLFQVIENITGVRGFVRFGGCVETVPACIVDALRARAGPEGVLREDALPFAPGQAVIVRVGGQETTGIFKDYVGPCRAIIAIHMLGRVNAVRCRLGDLRLCEC